MSKIDALTKMLYGKDTEKVAVIHTMSGNAPSAGGAVTTNSTTVAFVEVEKALPVRKKLEIAFVKTNTMTQSWVRNEGVEYIGLSPECRSTSVGDMVLIGTTKYVCKLSGWEFLDGEAVK